MSRMEAMWVYGLASLVFVVLTSSMSQLGDSDTGTILGAIVLTGLRLLSAIYDTRGD